MEKDLMDSIDELSRIQKEIAEETEKECEEYWESLPYEDKLKAFYSVCKRIHKGDIQDQGSYRYVLYQIFGFDTEAYSIGMECGYMDIHNYIDVKKF